MKTKKFFTILVCSVMLFGISCSDENLPVQTADNDPAQARLLSDEVEDATGQGIVEGDILPPSTIRTDDVNRYLTDYKAVLKESFQESQTHSSSIIIVKLFDDTEPTAYLVESFGSISNTYRIYNYPQYAKEWNIPEEGLPVVLSGKAYPASFNPGFHRGNDSFFDLELTTIKRVLQ
ncbi:MAG: hypothetical protein LBS54_05805 [Dysgonamonadaceae bacterium]|jgi:hypothetical protein|nr:hypothetical protein [Dysgonamonadaceae bacterium]